MTKLRSTGVSGGVELKLRLPRDLAHAVSWLSQYKQVSEADLIRSILRKRFEKEGLIRESVTRSD